MEEEMEMDTEMEIEPVFEVREVDLEYEFDAARFFDFTREESPAEAREAELWLESAPSYPPSRQFLCILIMFASSKNCFTINFILFFGLLSFLLV